MEGAALSAPESVSGPFQVQVTYWPLELYSSLCFSGGLSIRCRARRMLPLCQGEAKSGPLALLPAPLPANKAGRLIGR